MTTTTAGPAETLGRPMTLPCGATLENRFVKSAMSESLSTVANAPSEELFRLYDTWAKGGTGLLITGHVMVDPSALGEPRNVVVQDDRDMKALEAWAEAGTREGGHLWMQLNHPGKQVTRNMADEPVAPSALPLAPSLRRFFNPPRALREEEIHGLVARFARSAATAKEAGFTGVQIHGAHGYLVSQFLSPRHNQRTDDWGGSAENRMRFALEVYRAIRDAVGSGFPVGIKLNSADFMKGGFTEEESLDVASRLAAAGLDLLEISGGSFESPSMTGTEVRESTRRREAYFLEYAEKVREREDVPLVLTGGFRTAEGMGHAVASRAVDMVGLARPLAVDPDLPAKILAREDYRSPVRPLKTGIRTLDKMAMLEVTWYVQQLERIARNSAPRPDQGVWSSLVKTFLTTGMQTFQRKRARA